MSRAKGVGFDFAQPTDSAQPTNDNPVVERLVVNGAESSRNDRKEGGEVNECIAKNLKKIQLQIMKGWMYILKCADGSY